MRRYEILVPNLDLPGVPILLSAWLAKCGELVVEGDRVAELLAGQVTIDLASPATGILSQCLVGEKESVAVGQSIGVVASRQ